MKKIEIINKRIYHINFSGNIGSEINKIHLGIIFQLPGLSKMVLCIPLTSPKIKHFKTEEDYKKRNGRNLSHFSWFYIKQTDSILKLDQIKTISTLRIISNYKINDKNQILNETDYNKIKSKIEKYFKKIFI